MLDGPGDLAIDADADHQQEVTSIDPAHVYPARLTIDEDLARSVRVERNTHFTRPDVDGAGGQHGQGRLTAHQSLNDVVDCAIAARRYHHVRALVNCFARQIASVARPLRVPQIDLPVM